MFHLFNLCLSVLLDSLMFHLFNLCLSVLLDSLMFHLFNLCLSVLFDNLSYSFPSTFYLLLIVYVLSMKKIILFADLNLSVSVFHPMICYRQLKYILHV